MIQKKLVGQFMFANSAKRALHAEPNGNVYAIFESSDLTTAAVWNVYLWPDDKVSLQNFATRQFLTVAWREGAEERGVFCDKVEDGIWEKWSLFGSENYLALQCYHEGWLYAETPSDTNESGRLYHKHGPVGWTERWSMIPAPMLDGKWWSAASKAISNSTNTVPIIVPPRR